VGILRRYCRRTISFACRELIVGAFGGHSAGLLPPHDQLVARKADRAWRDGPCGRAFPATRSTELIVRARQPCKGPFQPHDQPS
jgi:hypothetical protein